MYAGTRHVLPARGDNPRPNLLHVCFHVLFIVNLVLAIRLRFPKVPKPHAWMDNALFGRLRSEWNRAFGGDRGRPPISLLFGMHVRELSSSNTLQRYSLYSPELSLIAETTASTDPAPPIGNEYIWFGGQPAVQIETATGATHYYFNDHLGTPILQTNASGAVDWRVEYEPYGSVWSTRTGLSRHQPLRFPGQEYDDLDSDREYNIFR